MSSSFRLYLTSDDQTGAFSNNTASHFQTHFDNPIELQGTWKAALENITYSSHIKTRPTTLHFHSIPASEKAIWSKHPFQYRLSEDEHWLGWQGVQPSPFKVPHQKIESLLETLNSMNNLILHDGDKRKLFGDVFRFSFDEASQRVIYESFDANFTLGFSNRLAKVLGFEYHSTFIGDKKRTASKPHNDTTNLKADECWMIYFNEKLQFRERRIVIKEKGKWVKNANDFLTLWKQTVGSYVDIRASFYGNKLVLTSNKRNAFFASSPDFCLSFSYPRIFLRKCTHAWNTIDFTLDNTKEEWYIDLYSDRMAFENVSKKHTSLTLYPWQCKTFAEVVRRINHKVNMHLKHVLKGEYDDKQHAFKISVNVTDQILPDRYHATPKDYVHLSLGQRVVIDMNENLRCLLGLASTHSFLNRNHTIGDEKVGKCFLYDEYFAFRCNLFNDNIYRFPHLRTDDSFININFKEPYFYPIPNTITSVICKLQDSKGQELDLYERPTMLTLKCSKQSQ